MSEIENPKRSFVGSILELSKIRITFAVTITTAVGYLVGKGYLDFESLPIILGVLLLSSGSSALNQFQEIKYDKLMQRTKNRPLANSTMSVNVALVVIITLMLSGLYLLSLNQFEVPFLLGLFAIFWYNIVYTPLKRVSSLAVVPGALIGSIPPAIGWAATGASIFEPAMIVLALFIFVWQMPHFWLLVMIYDDDYRLAKYPMLTDLVSHGQLSRITYSWIVGLAFTGILAFVYSLVISTISLFLIIILGVYLVFSTKHLISKVPNRQQIRRCFFILNNYVLVVLAIMSIDKLLN